MKFTDLPALGAPLEGDTFAGIATLPDGKHVAVVLLPGRGENLNHAAADAWAQERGGQLPTRPIAALLFANVKHLLKPEWHWCLENQGASYAWYCYFSLGTQYRFGLKSFEGSAVAVRLIPITGET